MDIYASHLNWYEKQHDQAQPNDWKGTQALQLFIAILERINVQSGYAHEALKIIQMYEATGNYKQFIARSIMAQKTPPSGCPIADEMAFFALSCVRIPTRTIDYDTVMRLVWGANTDVRVQDYDDTEIPY